jgi:hypothetical protein
MSDWAAKAYQAIIESGNDWADKESAASFLEHSRHSILAELKNNQESKLSDAAKETIARASPEYVEHVKAMTEARKSANIARVKWEASKTLASLRQTQESLKKGRLF